MGSLWGEEFVVKRTPPKKVINKVNNPKDANKVISKAIKSSNIPLEYKLDAIRTNVYKILGRFVDDTQVIRTREELTAYIDAAIANGEIAIDTETNNSLDPITCKLMGPCIYTPGQKNAYIPLNHVNPVTYQRLENQLTEADITEEFNRLVGTKIIMHNGKFDYKVIKCTCGVQLKVYWDTMVAVRILDENEKSAKLKDQYRDKIDSSVEKYSIDHLFEDIEYAIVEPELFALYAATDAFMTYKLYKWQQLQFNQPGHERLSDLFHNIEMPVMEVAAEMELTGVEIDIEYANRLSQKYHKLADDVQSRIDTQLEAYRDVINEWRKTEAANFRAEKVNKKGETVYAKSKSEQLKDPPQLTSPTQFAILLYDVLGTPVIDKKSPRGTGEAILEKIDNPLCELVLEQRGLEKLISTYIDKLPRCVNAADGRLHAHFNQLGTDTGRFSSNDPNLQNIPSHNKEIRLMFKASDGYVMVGGDFSQQEPRLLAEYAQDENMISAYKQNKDLYATIACGVYKNTYWDNMEHFEDGSPNPMGKKRRGNCKSILLGLMYGRGNASIADQIGASVKEADKIIDDFYTGFPKVREWMDKTIADCKLNGYVEDFWGRRRRLLDINLPKYTITDKSESKNAVDINPLLGSKGLVTKVANPLIEKYQRQLDEARGWKQVNAIKEAARFEKIDIRDNGAFISQAERQSVNSRVQGGAATMSKLAMRKVFDSEELRALGFRMLLQVHDELIGECPAENADKVAQLLSDIMKISAAPTVQIPFKCDTEISPCWYYDDFKNILQDEYKKLLNAGNLPNDAYNIITARHEECTDEQLRDFLSDVL